MDLRTMQKFGWITTKDGSSSLLLNGNVIVDIEHYPFTYWRIVYYDKYQGQVRLRFAFENAALSEADIRLKVETKIRERTCLKPTPSDNIRTSASPGGTSARIKARSG